jgi:hypothetical protein
MEILEYSVAANKALIGHTQWDASNNAINTKSIKSKIF